MIELEKLFDPYSFNARVKPAFLLVFPIVISLFTLWEPTRTWGGASLTFIVTFGIITFAANQLSTMGNILQERLFLKWGGSATTIILRHSDNRLDLYTKARYMAKLREKIINFVPVTPEEEARDMKNADEMYRSAANFLREHTRNTNNYPLVFNENVAFGFSRNIRAVKGIGITISFLCLMISLIVIWIRLPDGDNSSFLEPLAKLPFEHIGLIALHCVVLLSWIFLVTEKWVEVRAFAYAKRLYASCESL